MGNYSGNHPRFSRKQEESYDAKQAHNTGLTASARLHYLENDETHHPARQAENVLVNDSALDAKGRDAYATNPYNEGHEGGTHPARQNVTWDPKESDMAWPMRILNSFSGNIGNFNGGTSAGDVFDHYQRHGGPTGSVNVHGKKQPGANFFPVKGGKRGVNPQGETLQAGPGAYSSADGVVGDSDMDGDTMFHDYNQDGTMLGRGIRRFQNWLNK